MTNPNQGMKSLEERVADLEARMEGLTPGLAPMLEEVRDRLAIASPTPEDREREAVKEKASKVRPRKRADSPHRRGSGTDLQPPPKEQQVDREVTYAVDEEPPKRSRRRRLD